MTTRKTGFYSQKYQRYFKNYETMLAYDRLSKYNWVTERGRKIKPHQAIYRGKTYLPDQEYRKKYPTRILEVYGKTKQTTIPTTERTWTQKKRTNTTTTNTKTNNMKEWQKKMLTLVPSGRVSDKMPKYKKMKWGEIPNEISNKHTY